VSTPARAIDSWVVVDGAARGIERHHARFVAACADADGPAEAVVDAFWTAVLEGLPRSGSWWPRVDLTHAGELTSRLRPLPPTTGPLTVAVCAGTDPRIAPRRKGPDLDLLGAVRSASGAGEALLTSADGEVLEGTTTSLLWWEGDTLCHPDPALPILAGVTTAVLLEGAVAQGITPEARQCQAAELDGRETWLVNAVYGIRPVTRWVGNPITAGPAPRAAEWQRWLDGQRTALT
jgi:branched-subunit amino acid aminotransferase/4-amino-4-deoxychorismate lyase